MSQLETLPLSFIAQNRSSFIDGDHLHKHILCHMLNLRTFIFDIVTEKVMIKKECLPLSDDIRRTFMEKGYLVDCYRNETGRCHVYSLSYSLKSMHYFTNNFPGGLFLSVRRLTIYDTEHSFELNFFDRLSQSFPLLRILSLQNATEQEKKRSNEDEQQPLLITYSHLTNLYFGCVHVDYLQQFLVDSNTCLPRLQRLYIKYEDLVTETENFTNNATRATCSKLKEILFDEGTIVRSKEFSMYFPLL